MYILCPILILDKIVEVVQMIYKYKIWMVLQIYCLYLD